MENEYIRAINGLIEDGDVSFSAADYAVAGRSFKWALDSYPVNPVQREKINRSPKQLKANMDICCQHMMEQGLQEYRQGKLESAIIKWKGLLTVIPNHKEARKALETASIQLQALQNMEKR